MAGISKQSFFTAALGTMVEYYDCALFIIFLPIVAPLFFPAHSAYESLVRGYFILLISMIARPLGGLLFGYLGDVFGRRKALLGSMYGIAIATLIIGFTPSYITIGAWATIIIIIAKATQMFFFGGEYNGAGIYVVEHTQGKNEGLMGGLLTAATLCGALCASVLGILLTLPGMPTWSWRLAFIFGGIIGIIGIIARKNLIESPSFTPANLQQHNLRHLIQNFPRELVAGIFIGGFSTAPYTTTLAFISPVLVTQGYFNYHQFMLLQTLIASIGIVTTIIAGRFADKIPASKIMRFAALSLIVLTYPLLRLIDLRLISGILFSLISFIVINQFLLGPANAYFKNAFAMHYRYRGSSLSFCLGMSIIGGATPLVENFLYQWTGHFSGIALWLMFIAAGTFLSLHLVEKKPYPSLAV